MNVHSVIIVENTLSRPFCGFFCTISYGQLPVFVAAFYLNNSYGRGWYMKRSWILVMALFVALLMLGCGKGKDEGKGDKPKESAPKAA